MSNLPVPVEAPGLPAMYDDVETKDIQLPNIYLQTGQSKGVAAGITSPGDVILALGADDGDPTFLITKNKPSFEAYVISRKRFAATTQDNRIQFHRDNKKDPDDPNSWEGFFYLLSMPDVDDTVPARIMLWKMAGRAAAKKINHYIERARMQDEFVPPRVKFTLNDANSRTGIPYKQWNASLVQPDEYLQDAIAMMSFGSYTATENDAPDVSSDNAAPAI